MDGLGGCYAQLNMSGKERNTVKYHLNTKSKNKSSEYNEKETDSQRQKKGHGYQTGEERKEGQNRGRGLRGINHYV